ncbi:MAG TPA: MFS transporter [Bacteroidetes bacterium]|nr:MFS transporter [Bacteroidota bacterium]
MTKVILVLSFVSFFADISSEMLYPIMPVFLASIGFGALGIGALEAMAKLIAGLGKSWFGSLSDQLDRRLPFVRIGYLLSALAKPVMGLLPYASIVFAARSVDRVGKGMRGSARDAMLVAASKPADRGKVFGFHRGMDTLGAVVGPILALIYLQYRPEDYASIFIIAFAPGLVGVALTFTLPRETPVPTSTGPIRPLKGIFAFWRKASPQYRRILLGILLFALLNSTDMLLLLRAADAGLSPAEVIGAYILYNLVYATLSLPFGILSDRIGFRTVYLISVLVFATCYLGMGLATAQWMIWGIFILYGVFTAANEGTSKPWLSLHIPKETRATGLGLAGFLDMVCLALASLLAGLGWEISSGSALFIGVGSLAFFAFFLLLFIFPTQPKTP